MRVLQHMSPATASKKDDKLNLSSEESMSAGSVDDGAWAEGAESERDAMTTSATIDFHGLPL